MSPSITSAATSSPNTQAPSSAAAQAASDDPLSNESTFLTLLVSQLQNQDPLDPTDSNEFVSQLTSFSQLEQLIGIHQDTTTLADPSSTSTSSSGSTQPTQGAN